MTVTRRASAPERQLAAVAQLAEQLAHQWDAYLATVAALAPPLLRAAGRDPGRGSGHADPTANLVLACTPHDDIVEAIDAWLAQGRWIAERMLHPVAAEGPRAALGERERRAALCADPLCGSYAVARGLCKPHYDAERYRERVGDSTSDGGRSTSSVLGSVTPATSARIEGTCGRCGTKVHGVSVSHVHDLLAEHHATDCAAR
jgi:hypothetical protein